MKAYARQRARDYGAMSAASSRLNDALLLSERQYVYMF